MPAVAPCDISPANRAVFTERLIARICDCCAVIALSVVAGILLGVLSSLGLAIPIGVPASYFVLGAAYYVLLESKTGATIGKRLLGLRVVNMQGGPITAGQAILRWFGRLLSAATLGIGYLMACGAGRRTLHDRFSGTLVVREVPYE